LIASCHLRVLENSDGPEGDLPPKTDVNSPEINTNSQASQSDIDGQGSSGFGRIQSRVNVANGPTRFTPLRNTGQPVSAGFEHVVGGHFGRPLGNNRSVFSITPSELRSVLQSRTVVDSPVTSLGGGQFSRTVDIGRTIGNASLNQGGAATSRLRVLTDSAGNLITTFPVK